MFEASGHLLIRTIRYAVPIYATHVEGREPVDGHVVLSLDGPPDQFARGIAVQRRSPDRHVRHLVTIFEMGSRSL